MKTLAIGLILLGIVAPTRAAVVWDESVNGNLSTDPAAPTVIVFSAGSNIVNGSCGNINAQTRDYMTFTVPAGYTLTALNLLVYTPENTGFCAVNGGNTSIIPGNPTIGFWMAGIHVVPGLLNTDLFDAMSTASVTTEALPSSQLDPGDYTLIIQQTSPLITTYSFEFVLQAPVPTQPSTWGSVKALYR